MGPVQKGCLKGVTFWPQNEGPQRHLSLFSQFILVSEKVDEYFSRVTITYIWCGQKREHVLGFLVFVS